MCYVLPFTGTTGSAGPEYNKRVAGYILYEAHRTAVVAAAADAAVKCPLRTSDIAFYVVSLII